MARLRLVIVLVGILVTLLAGSLRQAQSQTTAAALVASAEAKIQAGDYPGAMVDVTQAIALDPRNAEAYGNRGLLREVSRDLDGALEDYTRAINYKPEAAVGYLLRMKARLGKGELDGAIADAQQVLKLLPESLGASQAQHVLMLAYFERAYRQPTASESQKIDATTRGIEAANTLIAWDPDFVDALVYKSIFLRLRAMRETNTDAQALLLKQADVLSARGKELMDRARADGDPAPSAVPLGFAPPPPPPPPPPPVPPAPVPAGDRAAYLKSAELKWDDGNIEGAIEDLTRAVALDRQDLEALFLRSFLNLAQGHLDDAIIDLTQISSINPKHAPSFAYRAVARFRKNDLNGAIADAEHAIELDDTLRLAHRVRLASYWDTASPASTQNERRRADAALDGSRAADSAMAALVGEAEPLIFKSLFLRAEAGFETDMAEQAAMIERAASLKSTAERLSMAGAEGPVRVGGAIPVPTKVVDVPVHYPDIAKQARVQGMVILEVLVDGRGRVADAKIIKSIPLLDNAALQAVRQWVYTPTIVDGMPTLAVFNVTANFTIQ